MLDGPVLRLAATVERVGSNGPMYQGSRSAIRFTGLSVIHVRTSRRYTSG